MIQVVENSFWLWFERCAFTDQGASGKCAHPYKPPCDWGQRPTVILRGQYSTRDIQLNDTGKQAGVPGVYVSALQCFLYIGLCVLVCCAIPG